MMGTCALSGARMYSEPAGKVADAVGDFVVGLDGTCEEGYKIGGEYMSLIGISKYTGKPPRSVQM
jgi:hypothetical protein